MCALKSSTIFFFITFLFGRSDCARILGVIPIPSFSHQVFYRPLWRELSLRGHEVVLLTTDPMNDKSLTNLTEINLHGAYQLWRMPEIAEDFKDNTYKIMTEATEMMFDIIRYELSHPEVRKLIENKSEHFDLVMIENMMPDVLAFSTRFECPFIGLVSLDAGSFLHELMGNPAHPVIYPDFQLPFVPPLNLAERIISVVFTIMTKLFANYYVSPRSNENIRRYFGEGYPSIEEIQKNISFLFTNTNPAFEDVRPLLPNTIPIGGGTHMRTPTPLPKDIQSFLDNATDGAIYISFGSNVKSKHISEEVRSAMINAMRELPYKILWKFEEDIDSKPENVMIVKWCPQQDVLRHQNIKLFITQGGLQSTEEAIMSHVPMVGIPFFMDQQRNVKKIVQKGLGFALDKDTVTKDILFDTVIEAIRNSK